MKELYEREDAPITIHCDNQSTIALALNNKFHARTKHIDIHYHFVRSVIENGTIDLQYIPSAENVADVFTKALPAPRFKELRKKLMVECAQGGVLDTAIDDEGTSTTGEA
jgi:hypothetical protein